MLASVALSVPRQHFRDSRPEAHLIESDGVHAFLIGS
jgi:hypothetical protein